MVEPRYRGVRDLLLFASALPLARWAQRVRDTRLPDVVAEMARRGPRSPEIAADRLAWAAGRATARWARWFGGLDTCLTRSLVTGSLLSGHGEVVLHLGFRPGEADDAVDGHAWITLNGEPVGADGHLAEERYERTMSIPFEEGEER
jgi:hypothetical protein